MKISKNYRRWILIPLDLVLVGLLGSIVCVGMLLSYVGDKMKRTWNMGVPKWYDRLSKWREEND